jgi:hypothetical protein
MSNLPNNIGVHVRHCCVLHGCKYGDLDCPVELKTHRQEFPCETCGSKYWGKINRVFNNELNEFDKWFERVSLDSDPYSDAPIKEECWNAALETFLDYIHERESTATENEKRYSYLDLIEIVSKLR